MENKIQSKGVYTGLDLFKLIAAYLIVLLHAIETSKWYPNEIKFIFTRFAVPFFFIASGYLLYQKLESSKSPKSYFIRYEKKLLLIFAIWNVLYLPFMIVSYYQIHGDEGLFRVILLLVRRFFLIGAGPYWYLLVLLITSAILYLIYKYSKYKILYGLMVIGFVLLIPYTCFKSYWENLFIFKYIFKVIYTVFSYEFNFIMYGIPFMGLGFIFARKDVKMSSKSSVAVLVTATLLRVFEYNLPLIFNNSFFKDNPFTFAYIPQAIAFFMLAIQIHPPIKKEHSLAMRQLSSFTYFSHAILMYNVLDPIMDKTGIFDTYGPAMIAPKTIFIILVCFGLFVIIKKINNRHLNLLING